MPRSKKGASSSSSKGRLKELGKLLATRQSIAEEEDETSSQDDPYYQGGFGTRRGTVCHCARCLRRSGPLTDDPMQVVDEIEDFLQDVDTDGSLSGFKEGPASGTLQEHHRLLAETTSLAVERGNADVAKALLDNIPDQFMQADFATKVTVSAAQHGHAHLIYLLDEYGADFEEPDPARGGPPLMHAANNGHVATVNALLECGAQTEATDDNSQTALMVAIFSDRASAAEALLAGGASVDTVDNKGRTALSHAARYGSLDCISVLAQHQANVFHVDSDGRTPLDIAEDCCRLEAAAQLKRLQQRQRLRERKEARQKDSETGSKFDKLELMQKEAEALKNALALLEEEETEAQQRAARKQKVKKNKRKGKASASSPPGEPSTSTGLDDEHAAGVAGDGAEDITTIRHTANGHVNQSGSREQVAYASTKSRVSAEDNAPQDSSPSPSEATTTSLPADLPADRPRAANGAAAEQTNGKEIGVVDPLFDLRQAWDRLLEEAAGCQAADRQATLLEEVRGMAEKCAAAGVSVKYGKKVLGKLERVAPVRAALTAAVYRSGEGERETLEAALEQARGLRSLLDAQLLADAESRLQQLDLRQVENEQRIAASTDKAVASSHAPGSQKPTVSGGTQSTQAHHINRLEALIASTNSKLDQSALQLRQQPSTVTWPAPFSASLGAPVLRLHANGQAAPSGSPSPLWPAQHTRPAPLSPGHRPAAVRQAERGHTDRPASIPVPGPRLPPRPLPSNGRISPRQLPRDAGVSGYGEAQAKENGVQPHSEQATSRPASPALNFGALFPTSGAAPQMHDQGLANIWQQQTPRTGGDATASPTPGFFSGSLFDMPLPLSRQMPSAAQQPVHLGSAGPQTNSLFSFQPQSVLGGQAPAGQQACVGGIDWLNDLLGRNHAGASDVATPAGNGTAPNNMKQPSWHKLWTSQDGAPGPGEQQSRPEDAGTRAPGRPKPALRYDHTGHHLWGPAAPNGHLTVPEQADTLAGAHSLSGDGKPSVTPSMDAPGYSAAAIEVEECVVCMAAAQEFTCIPCNHRAMCGPCSSLVAAQIGHCPICRCPIERMLHSCF